MPGNLVWIGRATRFSAKHSSEPWASRLWPVALLTGAADRPITSPRVHCCLDRKPRLDYHHAGVQEIRGAAKTAYRAGCPNVSNVADTVISAMFT